MVMVSVSAGVAMRLSGVRTSDKRMAELPIRSSGAAAEGKEKFLGCCCGEERVVNGTGKVMDLVISHRQCTRDWWCTPTQVPCSVSRQSINFAINWQSSKTAIISQLTGF